MGHDKEPKAIGANRIWGREQSLKDLPKPYTLVIWLKRNLSPSMSLCQAHALLIHYRKEAVS